jgi:hypothetical protein
VKLTHSNAQGAIIQACKSRILAPKFTATMFKIARLLLCALLFWLAPGIFGHQTTDSYLSLSVTNKQIEGRWAISLRDLDHILTVDEDKDGEVSDTELSKATPKIEQYAFSRLKVVVDSQQVEPQRTGFELEEHSDAVYATLLFVLRPETNPSDFLITYTLFNDTDPLHRGLFRFDLPNRTATAIFSPAQPTQRFVIGAAETPKQLLNFIQEGVWHIWTGYDHILFLIALLLPSALRRQAEGWAPTESRRAALINIVKVVTAFTVAHSITLTLAALNVVQLPSRFVESVIAASIVVAAINNLKVVFAERTWMIAFVFGLIHGFGFASALTDLHLSPANLAGALVGFNVGVELGQLAIVAVFVPIAFAMRRTKFYPQIALRYCSIMIGVLAAAWFVERAFDRRILPF